MLIAIFKNGRACLWCWLNCTQEVLLCTIFIKIKECLSTSSHPWLLSINQESQQRFTKIIEPMEWITKIPGKVGFWSTSLPRASTKWVRSTFSSHYPLSSKQCLSIIDNLLPEDSLGTLGIKLGAAWFGSKSTNHCAMLTPNVGLLLRVKLSCRFFGERSLCWQVIFQWLFRDAAYNDHLNCPSIGIFCSLKCKSHELPKRALPF